MSSLCQAPRQSCYCTCKGCTQNHPDEPGHRKHCGKHRKDCHKNCY